MLRPEVILCNIDSLLVIYTCEQEEGNPARKLTLYFGRICVELLTKFDLSLNWRNQWIILFP